MVAESWENPQHWYQTNVMATTRVYDHIAKSDNRPKTSLYTLARLRSTVLAAVRSKKNSRSIRVPLCGV